jgi:lysophospholipase L1-like esterase
MSAALPLVLGAAVLPRLGVASPAAAHRRLPARISQLARGRGLTVPIFGRAVAKRAGWRATWGAASQAPEPGTGAARGFSDRTIRNVVFTSVGGTSVRVRFTNAFGTRPLRIGRAAIALTSAGAAIVPGTDRPLTFDGRPSAIVPPGAAFLSDPVAMTVPPLHDLSVSLFVPDPTGPATFHAVANQENYISAGDHAFGDAPAAFAAETGAWYFIDSVDVGGGPSSAGTIVALGDSITDGVGSRAGANARWPNDLSRRLLARHGPALGVVDEGIGGNRVLSSTNCCGPSAIDRFRSDVVALPGTTAVILLEGVNDIGQTRSTGSVRAPHTDLSAAQIIAGDQQIIAQAHSAGVKIYGATITPFKGCQRWSPAGEVKREEINRWIETSGAFDGVIDFAAVLAAPGDPQMLNPAYDSGDHIHPNDAGYKAMAGAIDLNMLLPTLPRIGPR